MELLVTIKYLHYISIFGVVSSVVAEHLLVKPKMTRSEISRVAKLDSIYGICAIMVLVMGLLMWFVVGKPASYYNSNWIFHLKVTLFIIVGLLSIIPTIYLLKNRKGDPDEVLEVPKKIKMMIRLELLILFLIPLLATLMANGVGGF